MLNIRKRSIAHFAVSALLAMMAATALGLVAQRWMTYELLYVDGGVALRVNLGETAFGSKFSVEGRRMSPSARQPEERQGLPPGGEHEA